MNWASACAVVIPCLNEAPTIGSLVREIRRLLPIIIVVDDGSNDQTAERAAAAGARVVRLERNRGKGAAVKAGIALAVDLGCGWGMTMDGDGQHRPDDMPTFLRCAEETQAELIVGDRLHNAQAMPWLRRTVNQWMSRRISNRAGQFLPDSQCGFRLISLKAWTQLRIQSDHFELESEVLLAFSRARHRVEFVPIHLIPKGPHSHVRPVVDALRWMRWWRRSGR